jgi:hypothetical protein
MPAAQKAYDVSRRNFLALIFCLMVGTAALPHILMRYYTVPSVKEARESVSWSLFFIFLLYFTAPALAVLVKFEVFTMVVGTPFDQLPAWVASWAKVDPTLLSVTDVNKDGILQLNEMSIGGDIVVLATPEIGGLPYVISGLVAAGGLAAALSTADGLLLTIANALSHDLYYKMIDPNASTARRVALSKMLLLVVALAALTWRRRNRPTSCSWCLLRSRSLAAVLPGPDPGDLLEARHRHRRVAGHGGRSGSDLLLHGHDPALAARRVRRHLAGAAVVGHPADLGRAVRRAGRFCRDHPGQPGDSGTESQDPGTGGICALPEPESELTHAWHRVPHARDRQARSPATQVAGLFFLVSWHIIAGFALPHPMLTLGAAYTTRQRVNHKEYACVTMKSF